MANWITTTVKAENFEILKEKLLRKPTEEELKEYSIKAFKENQKDMGSVNRK